MNKSKKVNKIRRLKPDPEYITPSDIVEEKDDQLIEKDDELIEEEVKEVKKRPSKIADILSMLSQDDKFKEFKRRYDAGVGLTEDDNGRLKDDLISYLVEHHHLNLKQIKSVIKKLFI